jgi:capsular polysaccharide transport system permease protein
MIFYRRRLFWVFVGIPNLISIVYFGFIASPQYVSESSLVVYQSASADNSPVTLNLGQNGGTSIEGDYLVQSFIASWRCFATQDHAALVQSWSNGDFVTRFGGLISLFNKNITSLYKYYLAHVSIDIDAKSAIMTVSVQGYDPNFARKLNQKILDESDDAVNDMNAQAYQNAENFFLGRVMAAKSDLNNAIISVTSLQKNSNVLNPSSAYSSQLALINQLTLKKVAMEAQLTVINKDTPNSAQVQGLTAEISQIDNEISNLSNTIKGKDSSLTSVDGDFVYNQALVQNAEANLLNVETQLLTAQQAALQHQYFMEYINQPSVPPNPTRPYRLKWLLGILGGTVLFYLIVKPQS